MGNDSDNVGLTLGIDATNSFSGGVFGYVQNLIRHANPEASGFKKVYLWAPSALLNKIEDKPWLEKVFTPALDKNVLYRKYFQYVQLEKELARTNCNILFSTGGIFKGNFTPLVIVNHNMLPYEKKELERAPFLSVFRWKLVLLGKNQLETFRRASGIVFTSNYAKNIILNDYLKNPKKQHTVIYNGTRNTFDNSIKPQFPISEYSEAKPYRLLYASSVISYKHHNTLIEAVANLRKQGFPVFLDMVGPVYVASSKKSLDDARAKHDPTGVCTRYQGFIENFNDFLDIYRNADAFVFSSSCENLPTIILEYMTAGRPIASSHYGPMPEVLEENAFFYDPESVQDTMRALVEMIQHPELRLEKTIKAKELVKKFDWSHTSTATFDYLASVCRIKSYPSP